MRKLNSSTFLCLLPALALATALMSQADSPRSGSTRKEGPGEKSIESSLADCLIQANEKEVILSEIALKRATTQSVKDFAKMMIQDHNAMIEKLQEAGGQKSQQKASGAGATEKSSSEKPEAGRPSDSERVGKEGSQARSRDESGVKPAGGDLLAEYKQIGDELHEQCLASAKKELEQKSGAEFEKCYVGMQLAAHMQAIDAITVFKKHASGKLSTVLASALPTVQGHLDHAKALMRKLEGGRESAIVPASSNSK